MTGFARFACFARFKNHFQSRTTCNQEPLAIKNHLQSTTTSNQEPLEDQTTMKSHTVVMHKRNEDLLAKIGFFERCFVKIFEECDEF